MKDARREQRGNSSWKFLGGFKRGKAEKCRGLWEEVDGLLMENTPSSGSFGEKKGTTDATLSPTTPTRLCPHMPASGNTGSPGVGTCRPAP